MQEQCKLKKILEEEVRLLCGNILDFDREVRKITDVQDGSATAAVPVYMFSCSHTVPGYHQSSEYGSQMCELAWPMSCTDIVVYSIGEYHD